MELRLLGVAVVFALIGFVVAQALEQPSVEKLEGMKAQLKAELIKGGNYKCCLAKPCDYCLEEGSCSCMEEIMRGEAPCGECLGEILEGNGNPFLKQYFAKSLAEEMGEENLAALEKLVEEKYGA